MSLSLAGGWTWRNFASQTGVVQPAPEIVARDRLAAIVRSHNSAVVNREEYMERLASSIVSSVSLKHSRIKRPSGELSPHAGSQLD